MTKFHRDDLVIESRSTLRVRDGAAVETALSATGYDIDEVRDTPDRPGLEYVFIATRP